MGENSLTAIILTIDPKEFKLSDFILHRQWRCEESLKKFNIPYEIFYGPTTIEANDKLAKELNMDCFVSDYYFNHISKFWADWQDRHGDAGCQLSHTWAYQRCIDDNRSYIVLEFDAYMIKPIDFEIEDGKFYRLHEVPHGHGQVVTPGAAAKVIYDKRYKMHSDWFKGYDTHLKNKPSLGLVVRPGYVGGNETACEEQCTRFTRTKK